MTRLTRPILACAALVALALIPRAAVADEAHPSPQSPGVNAAPAPPAAPLPKADPRTRPLPEPEDDDTPAQPAPPARPDWLRQLVSAPDGKCGGGLTVVQTAPGVIVIGSTTPSAASAPAPAAYVQAPTPAAFPLAVLPAVSPQTRRVIGRRIGGALYHLATGECPTPIGTVPVASALALAPTTTPAYALMAAPMAVQQVAYAVQTVQAVPVAAPAAYPLAQAAPLPPLTPTYPAPYLMAPAPAPLASPQSPGKAAPAAAAGHKGHRIFRRS